MYSVAVFRGTPLVAIDDAQTVELFIVMIQECQSVIVPLDHGLPPRSPPSSVLSIGQNVEGRQSSRSVDAQRMQRPRETTMPPISHMRGEEADTDIELPVREYVRKDYLTVICSIMLGGFCDLRANVCIY